MLIQKTWTDRYGAKIKIKDMSTLYITNCLKMILRSINQCADATDTAAENTTATGATFTKKFVNKHAYKYTKIFTKELLRRAKHAQKE